VTQILDGLIDEYETVNVLKDAQIRDGIKEFSSWPTIPQLYVDGKFVGGCDIVREMFQSGELQELLGVKVEVKAPTIHLTPAAKMALESMREGEEGTLRLEVGARFEHALALDDPRKGDFEVDADGVKVLVDRASAARADGVVIDFVEEGGGGFRIDNPNAPPGVQQLDPADLKKMLDAGEPLHLYDVRTPGEREIASIEGSRLLDEDAVREIQALDKNAALVFMCHHGNRSQGAAQRFVAEGFRRVYNLTGGIEAWSMDVDPDVPRY
jgi:monothiol glutaredoxin